MNIQNNFLPTVVNGQKIAVPHPQTGSEPEMPVISIWHGVIWTKAELTEQRHCPAPESTKNDTLSTCTVPVWRKPETEPNDGAGDADKQ
jgi:hypothetical protein